jgi:molybdopterin-containing oxidoreductase family membrane subunit
VKGEIEIARTPAGSIYRKVGDDVFRVHQAPGPKYYALLLLMAGMLIFGGYCWTYLIERGFGVTGLNYPVGWAMLITNFVFWVGIAHSGTLISAILYLFRARWRVGVFRSAEAMTVFALMTAGLFPIIHLGRSWYFYWLFPYPNQRELWQNFRSPLMWDVFAISAYMTVSVMFLYLGMIPDLSTMRDRARGLRRKIYGLFSLGWQGTGRQWSRFGTAYLFFAGLATPLVISVHSVVSWDFAMSIVPGWHSTIFAPYFVAGAIHSGLAMVLLILVPMRKIYRLQDYITNRDLENLTKLIVVTGLIMFYSYATEAFMAWYSHNPYEQAIFAYRAAGHYRVMFWIMIGCNSIIPLAFFWKRVRTHLGATLFICFLIVVGMWSERFVIIVTSLAHEYDPSSWSLYHPTWVELGITAGSFGWFFFWFLLFIKLFPPVAVAEVREIFSTREPA